MQEPDADATGEPPSASGDEPDQSGRPRSECDASAVAARRKNLGRAPQPSTSNRDVGDTSTGEAHATPDEPAMVIDLVIEAGDDEPTTSDRSPHGFDSTDADWLTAQIAAAARTLNVNGSLALAIVDDTQMADLHERYTGVAGTTDVLTFDLADDDFDAPADNAAVHDVAAADAQPTTTIDGEIILCVDEAHRQAKRRKHALRDELLLYAVHGLLHLLGEDDHDPDAARRMHAREDQVLRAIGVGPVYAA